MTDTTASPTLTTPVTITPAQNALRLTKTEQAVIDYARQHGGVTHLSRSDKRWWNAVTHLRHIGVLVDNGGYEFELSHR